MSDLKPDQIQQRTIGGEAFDEKRLAQEIFLGSLTTATKPEDAALIAKGAIRLASLFELAWNNREQP